MVHKKAASSISYGRPYEPVARTTQEVSSAIQNARFDVGIISPLVAGDHGEIIRGLREENEYAPEVFAPLHYTTHDIDRSSITVTVKRAFADKVHAIVSIGAHVAQITSAILEKEAPDVPHICLSPGKSLGAQLVAKATAQSGNCATITLEPYDMTPALEFMHKTFPKKKRVLLPCHIPTEWEKKFREPITRSLIEKDYLGTHFTASNLVEGHKKISKSLKETDILLLPEGSGYNELGNHLAKICQAKNIVIFGGSVAAVSTYAPIGFGTDLTTIGRHATYYLQRILSEATTPAELPLKYIPSTRTPLLNKELAKQWNLQTESLEKNNSVLLV